MTDPPAARLNVNRDMFAFNKLQRQFLPEEYRPPAKACGTKVKS